MHTVSHHGRETAYEVTDRGGNGPSVCCVHGTGSTHARWRAQLPLADRNPLVALDLSGHGSSDDIEAEAGYSALSAYADDVLAVTDATGASVLLGSSLGGAAIMHAIVERDVRPDAAILTGAGARLGVLEDLLIWLETDFDRAIEFLHEPGRLFSDPEPALLERSKAAMSDCGQPVVRRDFETCHTFDVRSDLSKIDVPVLAICGERDQLTPPWFHEYLADEIPDASVVTIEDAAHLVMLEQPAAFNETVREFLETVEG
ncbi:alpha/beta hydrolase [Natrarchaeobius halalkaliphilus]|uniref:Alpha/beta hydrolase n=1 Tax=Natrarchaeobius halalkaliphilus TaxID=1679091 RepID=A0A3N6LJT6_9EURY|nr:alpha/beta hydrolase [Natrarchaeobius halalkaliphilus]RQG86184.1 alpha/beta hydrolase [Natrarchaeobius halalkaliphilus]